MAKKNRKKYVRRTVEQQIADLEARIEELKAKARGNDRFSPEAVAADRERLGLSAKQYGDIVGVSQMTIYNWEKGKSVPRNDQVAKWLTVAGMGKREAYDALGVEASTRTGFSSKAVATDRARLGLSARHYAELVGVNPLTIYSWEKGKTSPRDAQYEKWLEVKGMGKREAHDRLGIDDAERGGFSPEALTAERERLELSAADYGQLVGVSALTIYNWEKGKTKPQAAQLEKWKAVRSIGKKAAWKKLGYL